MPAKKIQYRLLIAPVVLLLFSVGWYEFSKVYIQGANSQLFLNNNYAVYVPLQQINAYMSALKDFTYLTAGLALVMFFYFLARSLQIKKKSETLLQAS